jgi:multidrug efflux system outer membrane protein
MSVRVSLVALSLLLAACSVGPEYKRPDLDVPSAYRAQEETPSAQSYADLAWWDVYQDETLRQLLKTALEQNKDMKIAAARVAEARAQLGVARLRQFPQVGIGASVQRGRVFQSGQYVTGGLYTAQAQVSYEVDLWQRLASLSDAARAELLATEFARVNVRVSLVGAVATAYFDLRALDQRLRITKDAVATREHFFELTQSKFRRGASSGLDVSRAEASLASARASLPDLQRQIEQQENQLLILLGQNPAPVAREAVELQAMPTPPEVPAGLPSTLLERRPDLREAEQALAGATARVRAAKAALFPTISLTGSLGSQSLALADLFSGPTKIWSVGLGVLQPLLDANRNGYQVDAAKARDEQALLQYQKSIQQAFQEVSDALIARRRNAEFLQAQEQQVQALRDADRRVHKRYDVGYSSYFEVVDADRDLLNGELQLVQAYRNTQVSLVQLYKALGGGWDGAGATGPAAVSGIK